MLTGVAPTATLEIDLANARSTRGVMRVCLTADPANFPSCDDDGAAVRRNVPAGTTRLIIPGLSPRQYAVSVIHDENGNGRLDTFAGIPREGFGFSRNPAIAFGPPGFDAARFPVASGAETQQVRLRYLL